MIAETQTRLILASRSERLPWLILTVTGLVLFVVGAVLAPERLGPGLLLYGYLLFGIAVGGLYFLAVHYGSGAGWATVLKRVPEALTSLLPAACLIVLAAFVSGATVLYPWLRGGDETAAFSPFKAGWFTPSFFFVRAVVYAAVLIAFGWALRRRSVAQDHDRDPAHTVDCRKLAVAYLVVGSFVVWLASFDWIMSLEPHWYSTIFGVYNFAGHFTGGLAAIILVVVWLRRRGVLPGVTGHHLHDLGKLLFAMSVFWMYMWFSQAMLIWYGNLAEEAIYFNARLVDGWRPLFVANVLLNWVIPFLVLLSRGAKRSPTVMVRVALVVLAGRWLDLYLMIYPPLSGQPVIGLLEVGGALALPGLLGFLVLRWLTRVSPRPTGDPFLEESLHFHQ